ncbi:glucose 1-dehydrogenase [Geodermatophilus sabuli]|uniref:Glucose 1-dehydrogenase n=1 Tax=Geodermatophilus sabuli TaxID=1564158 RepID=A0A7K3W4L5_9ACTN|nr:glucose 1-dehydrogenase [Geodermatophilus sabuli]
MGLVSVQDRVAVVTGAAQGIGLGIAGRLARSGALVVVNDLDQQRAEEAAGKLAADTGATVHAVAADVGLREGAADLVSSALARFGRVDILVNNAGIGRDRTVLKLSEEDWDEVIRVNLKGPFLAAQQVMAPMREQKHGRIVNIGSRAWLGGFGQANYSAAKGGLLSLTRTLALEGARHGITANCVMPALIETPLFQQLDDAAKARLAGTVPMGRVGRPEDVAWAVESFAADEASYVTGQHVYVCGGRSLSSAE